MKLQQRKQECVFMCWVFFILRPVKRVQVNRGELDYKHYHIWFPLEANKKLKQDSSPTLTFPKIFSVEELLPKMRRKPEVNPGCLRGEPKQKSVLLMWKNKNCAVDLK